MNLMDGYTYAYSAKIRESESKALNDMIHKALHIELDGGMAWYSERHLLMLAVICCCQLRKSLRYLMSNLDDFEPSRNLVSYSEMQLVDQFTLHLLHKFISQVVSLSLLLADSVVKRVVF